MNSHEIIQCLETIAPLELAEDWDNVGLLIGDRNQDVTSILTCLTLTPDVAAEAIERRVGLVVSHHPILFRAVQRITTDTAEGRMLLDLIAARIAVYSPHTGYDSARDGINRQLAELFSLQDVRALRPVADPASDELTGDAADTAIVGGGRFGSLPSPTTLAQLAATVQDKLDVPGMQYVGDPEQRIDKLGVACGSAAEFLHDAAAAGCQTLLTGEARFHACLEARTIGIGMILPGHYATERPAMESLAQKLAGQFPTLCVLASESESDPIRWL
ncbi:MAG: Nif3-like dinuclear metal center hexameric protein [Planctomycetota bacterium]|nr:Nif3-like dinuclear metal center hexameric protein [Planctomycetota bacterium]